MKKHLLVAVMMLALVSLSNAQYRYDSTFPNPAKADSILLGLSLHGVAVGLDGNVWPADFSTIIKGDSLPVSNTGVNKAVLAQRVFKPDGSLAFPPLSILKGGGITDTMWTGNSGRGYQNTPDGNVLYTWFNIVYLLDYRNGAAITKIVPGAFSGTASAADLAGDIFTCPVGQTTGPLQMFNKVGVKQGNVTDTTQAFSRAITCSRDGGTIYYAGYTNHCVIKYTGDPLLGFVASDTVLKGFDCESICRAGNTDLLWASAGSGNDVPNHYPGATTYYSSHTWYLWDPATKAIKDSIKWNGLNTFTNADSVGVRPRGVATTAKGDTVYVVMFGTKTGMFNIQRFVKGPNEVRRDIGEVAETYTLSRNYPNPFNPSTTIKFTLPAASIVSLNVYDVLGKHVATLADGRYDAGSFTATFDGAQLNSGVYFYTFRVSNGFVQTGRMLLLK
jgi:hypothetical protein